MSQVEFTEEIAGGSEGGAKSFDGEKNLVLYKLFITLGLAYLHRIMENLGPPAFSIGGSSL